jgi:hypothetical protein
MHTVPTVLHSCILPFPVAISQYCIGTLVHYRYPVVRQVEFLQERGRADVTAAHVCVVPRATEHGAIGQHLLANQEVSNYHSLCHLKIAVREIEASEIVVGVVALLVL